MSIQILQKKIGVTPDGDFGPNTFNAAMAFYKMTPARAAHFFGQTAHESAGFKVFSENLNYSANGLKKIFGKYFPGNLAASYARKPEKIANRAYANRNGNGDEASGDGWRFRGRGAIQLTGRSNYQAFSKSIKDPEVLTNPNLVAGRYSFESAMFFFDNNNLWKICDRGVNDAAIRAVTKVINGGINGLADRVKLTKRYFKFAR